MNIITKNKLRSLFKNSRPSILLATASAVVVLLAGLAILTLRAAGFFVSVDASQASVSGNAKLVNDTTAYGGKIIEFTAPAPPPSGGVSCELPAYPKPGCTGVPGGTELTTVSGNITLNAGEQLVGKRVTGSVTVQGGNVLIKNSEIYGQINNWSGGPSATFTIQDSTIGAPSGCNGDFAVGARNYAAIRVHVRNFGDAFRVSGNDVTIKDSFMKLCSNPGDHSDGIQGNYAGVNNLIEHNTIDQRFIGDATSPVFWADESKDVRLVNNLLMGGGFTIRLHDGGGSNMVATGNRVVENSWSYGPVYSSCSRINPWSDNKFVTIDANYNITTVKDAFNCSGPN